MGKITNDKLLKLLDERLQSTAGLQSRIDELTDKLYLVNKKLKEAEALKGHFISNITNEIINPFSSILVLSENIQKLADGDIDNAKRMAVLINNEAFHLDFQLKNIFAAATIESGKEVLTISAVDVKNITQSVIRFFQKQIDSQEIQLKLNFDDQSGVELMKQFITDSAKLELIFKNLLSNAVKFSYPGSKIDLSLIVHKTSLEFTIRDFGKGVPVNERAQIFDRFKQIDECINSINTGHGLGLAIVKSYCFIMDGKVEMSFPQEGGTQVRIKLPLAEDLEGMDDLTDFMIDQGERF